MAYSESVMEETVSLAECLKLLVSTVQNLCHKGLIIWKPLAYKSSSRHVLLIPLLHGTANPDLTVAVEKRVARLPKKLCFQHPYNSVCGEFSDTTLAGLKLDRWILSINQTF